MSAVLEKGAPARRRALPLSPGQTAWTVLLPCVGVLLAAIVVLGPPLGRALFDSGTDALWPTGWWEARGHAEPAKHGHYMLAELAPLVFGGVVLVLSRRPPCLLPKTARALVLAGQMSVVGIVALAVLGQRHLILYGPPAEAEWQTLPNIFEIRDLVLAAMLVAGAAIVLRRRRRLAASIAAYARERPLTRVAGLAIATAFATTWLIEVVLSDNLAEDTGIINWVPDGTYAVLDGRTPLVDVHLVYAKLLPYPAALVLATFGATTFVFTVFLALLDLAAMLAVYAVFRRLVGSTFAVALFLPFVALSDAGHRMWTGGVWPMRYAGAYLVGWLTARHIDGAGPRRPWILFFVAGLVTLDTFDFGLAALLASVIALICARPPRSLSDATRLAGAVAVGALGALTVVAGITLARTGELPHADLLFEWPKIFTDLGWFSLPLPRASLHLAIYVTFAAAIAVAAVRLAHRAADVLHTAMLAWSGVFGLIAGNYYIARPDDFKLYAMFSAFAFALALLAIVCVRGLAARDWRAPAPAELLVLFGFALAVCMIGRFPSPTQHIGLLRRAPPPTYRSIVEPLVARRTQRGEKVAILLPESYRIAHDLGLDNVAPYEMENAIVTERQMATLMRVLEREGVTRLFTPTTGSRILGEVDAPAEHIATFEAAGFRPVDSASNMLAWERG